MVEEIDMECVVGKPGHCAIYQMFAKNGDPLYVGRTKYPYRRIATHFASADARWTTEVCHIEYEWVPAAVADETEKTLIEDLQPLYNTQHTAIARLSALERVVRRATVTLKDLI